MLQQCGPVITLGRPEQRVCCYAGGCPGPVPRLARSARLRCFANKRKQGSSGPVFQPGVCMNCCSSDDMKESLGLMAEGRRARQPRRRRILGGGGGRDRA